MKHACGLVLHFSSETADAISRALAPEAAQAEVPKTRGDVSAAEGALRIEIRAEDLPSLRASVNSHLRWVDAAERATRAAL